VDISMVVVSITAPPMLTTEPIDNRRKIPSELQTITRGEKPILGLIQRNGSGSNMKALLLILTAFTAALGFNGPSVNLMLLALSVGSLTVWGGVLLWRDFGNGELSLPSGIGPALMAAMFGWMSLSIFWSSWQQVSFYYVLIVGAMPLMFLLWLKEPEADAVWERLWTGLLLLAVGAAVWGLAEYGMGAKRANGPFLDANAYGALCNVFLLPAFFRYLALRLRPSNPFWQLRAYEIAFIVLFGALFATYSRGALGAFVLMLLFALALAFKRYGRRMGPALVTLLIIAGATYTAVVSYPEQSIDRQVTQLTEDRSTQARLLIWKSTWEIYKDNPFLGTGLGTYQAHYGSYRDPGETSTTGQLAHNDYLQVLQEGGPLLLAFLLAVGTLTLWVLYRCFRLATAEGLSTRDEERLFESYGLGLAVLALFAHAMVNFIFYVLPLSLIAGLYLAQAYRQCIKVEYRRLSIPLQSAVTRAALTLALSLPVFALAVDGVAAAVLFRQPPSALRVVLASEPEATYKLAHAIAALRPGNAVPAFYLAEVNKQVAATTTDRNVKRDFTRRALDQFARVVKINSHNAYSLTQAARLLVENPELGMDIPAPLSNGPQQLLQQAIRAQPSYAPAYLALAELYREQGDIEEAFILLQDARTWFVSPLVSLDQRIQITELALKLARQIGRWEAVHALAASLLADVPDHAQAQAALHEAGPR